MSSQSVVLLFAGQGSQAVGMGRSLADAYPSAKALLDKADGMLDFSLSEVMFAGPEEELTRTSRCQPALYVHGLMCVAALSERLGDDLAISNCAGLSLGEFTAHAAAGSFSFEQGLSLVAQRGQFMEDACNATDGAMAAMIGGTDEQVQALAETCGVNVANYNCPGQAVISGSREGVAGAIAGAKEAGIRIAKELKVAGAFHSQLMQNAQDHLKDVLDEAEIAAPSVPVISNLTANAAADPAEIRRTLEAQVTGSVQWTKSILGLLEQGQERFLECGPGKVLTGFMGRIRKGTFCKPTAEADMINVAMEALRTD